MKFILCFFITTLLLTGCASSKPAASANSNTASSNTVSSSAESKQERAASPQTPSGSKVVKVPVEKKAVYKFADGNLDEYLISKYDAEDINILSQLKYSASNSLIEQTDYKYQGGLLEEKITKDEFDNIRSMVRFQYNNQGQVVQEILEDKGGKPVTTYFYHYDADGNRTSRIINNAAGTKLAETIFTYNKGQLMSTETTDASGRRTGSSDNVYNDTGHRIAVRVNNALGAMIRVIESSWENDLEVQTERKSASGQLQRREKNEYGTAGELLRKSIEDIQNNSRRIIEYEYTFREELR